MKIIHIYFEIVFRFLSKNKFIESSTRQARENVLPRYIKTKYLTICVNDFPPLGRHPFPIFTL